MYYRWLTGNSLAHLQLARAAGDAAAEAGAAAVLRSVLAREVRRFEEDHVAAVPDAKWPLLTLARLKEAQARLGLCEGGGGGGGELLEAARGIYRRLMALDPMRRGYYQDAVDGKAFVVVQALGTA
jgi:geranylgeranyl transferase type-2 subunit alpha